MERRGAARRAAYFVACAALLAVIVGLILSVVGGEGVLRRTRESKPPPPAKPSGRDAQPEAEAREFRPAMALSLAALQSSAAASRQQGKRLSDELAHLGGLNRIQGFATDPQGDILLLGDSDAGLPKLGMDELAVALRNAYHVNPGYQGEPGCSIDPREGAKDPFEIQAVKVFGMPRTAPMAARFVTVDYEMKKVSAGITLIDRDVRSLYELHESASPICQDTSGKQHSVVSVHRFWFCARLPDAPRYLEDEGVIWIQKPVQVQLLTEREFLDATGRRTGGAAADPAAEQFAHSVTEVLQTNQVPQYVELRNDLRLIELASLLRYRDTPAGALGYLLEDHSIPVAPVPGYVGEIRREERGEAICESNVEESGGGPASVRSRSVRYHHLSRGGVSAGVPVAEENFTAGARSGLARVRSLALASRRSRSAFVWSIKY